MYVRTDEKGVDSECTDYRIELRECVYVRIGKSGWIRDVQVNGRTERCMSRQKRSGIWVYRL